MPVERLFGKWEGWARGGWALTVEQLFRPHPEVAMPDKSTLILRLHVPRRTPIIAAMATSSADTISAHDAAGDRATAILASLCAMGEDPDHPTIDGLAPVDRFRPLGKPAMRGLARRANRRAGMRVLDLGSGLGGPARVRTAHDG
jgi:hypothetical protein